MKLVSSLLAGMMALAFSAPLMSAPKIGEMAPEFSVKGHDGKMYKLSDLKKKHVVLEWWNKDCPYVKKHYDTNNMQELQATFTGKDVQWFTVLSSAPNKQGYMKAAEIAEYMKKTKGKPTVVLLDPDGKLGRMYDAKVTPHMYVINGEGKLSYNGAIDSISSTKKADVAKADKYLVNAVNASMMGKTVSPNVTKPYGCSIKYKSNRT
ncbi:MAG: redoxin domain-containing protein [Pseudobacteriovorax sp.]|nr:redoxin domain-containing protein [Pseudobacteriovorax sp.]